MAYIEGETGKRIYFEHYAGSKRPVVLIHGWGMNCRVWDTTLVALQANGNEVVAFDQRGCGQSDKDFADGSIGASAGDVVNLVKTLGLKAPILNGWSLGGAIAVEAAHRLQANCSGAILTCAASPRYTQAPDFPHGGKPGDVQATIAALQADRAGFLHGLSQAVCAADVGQPLITWMWQVFMEAAPSADRALAELGVLDQRDILAALNLPVLSVVGAKDVIASPEIGKFAGSLAKQGKVVVFESSGHAPFLEEGPRYRQEILTFINELS